MTADDPVVERAIVSSWPLVAWWCVTGEPGRWSRRRLVGAALVEATTTSGAGKSRQRTVTRYVTGLTLELGRAELAEGDGYFVCDPDWPTCGCETPRTSDMDRAWCSRCARLVPTPAPRPGTGTPRAVDSAVDQWIGQRREAERG